MIMNIRQRLNKNYNELNGLYHDISMKLGLSDSESMVMYMLYDIQEPLTQSDIVKATGLSKQTLNSAIRKLEKEGIIILEKLNEKSKKIKAAGEKNDSSFFRIFIVFLQVWQRNSIQTDTVYPLGGKLRL